MHTHITHSLTLDMTMYYLWCKFWCPVPFRFPTEVTDFTTTLATDDCRHETRQQRSLMSVVGVECSGLQLSNGWVLMAFLNSRSDAIRLRHFIRIWYLSPDNHEMRHYPSLQESASHLLSLISTRTKRRSSLYLCSVCVQFPLFEIWDSEMHNSLQSCVKCPCAKCQSHICLLELRSSPMQNDWR